jgi:hypothetical protein
MEGMKIQQLHLRVLYTSVKVTDYFLELMVNRIMIKRVIGKLTHCGCAMCEWKCHLNAVLALEQDFKMYLQHSDIQTEKTSLVLQYMAY